MRVNALGVRQSSPHSKNESVRLWRLLEGPVPASLPNSLELIPARCSGSAALSSKTRSRCEAGQTVVAGSSIQKDSALPQGPAVLPVPPKLAVSWPSGFREEPMLDLRRRQFLMLLSGG